MPFDRWFRYPAGFASDYLSTILESIDLAEGELLVDPFAGSGVAGTAARSRGLRFHGVEAHPLIAELARLKLSQPISPTDDPFSARPSPFASIDCWSPPESPTLGEAGTLVVARAKELLALEGVDVLAQEADLVQRCFAQPALEMLVALRCAVRAPRSDGWFGHLKWALLACLRDVAHVKVGWPYQRPALARKAQFTDVAARFLQRVDAMAADLATLAPAEHSLPSSAVVVTGDSRRAESWSALGDGAAAACVTSPPYLNNFDYADATRLELYFWTALGSWREMCSGVRTDMVVATTQQTTRPSAAAALEALDVWPNVAERCKALSEALAVERRARPRGKQYDHVLPSYVLAMGQVLQQVSRVLAPGASCVLLIGDSAPYGVYIDTPSVLAELGIALGLDRVSDEVVRTRGGRWTGAHRHSVALTERQLVLRRPRA